MIKKGIKNEYVEIVKTVPVTYDAQYCDFRCFLSYTSDNKYYSV